MKTSSPNPYEREDIRAALGGTLRPGGLAVTQAALDICGFRANARLLDLGCGAGATLRFLLEKGFEACGLDKSPALLASAQTCGEVVEGDFHRLPWPDGRFDGVFCECVLNLAADREAVIQECARVLKAGGRLVISDIFRRPNGSLAGGGGRPAGPVTTASLSRMLCGQGFGVTAEVDYGRALKELAARLVWRCGSRDILKTLWPFDVCECGAGVGGRFTCSLIIAEKDGASHDG